MKYIYNYLLPAFLLISGNGAFSQSDHFRYGKVTMEEMTMNRYLPDTSAAAVVLADYGCFDPATFVFTRTTRYKILKKTGTKEGSIVFLPHSPGANDAVSGVTFNLENGKIVKSKLESGSIFKENVTEHITRLRIAMPDLREGSVFDVEYSFRGLPLTYYFQRNIPVERSVLDIPANKYFNIKVYPIGIKKIRPDKDGNFVAEKIPAFHTEPYTNSNLNYLSGVRIVVTYVYLQYSRYFDDLATSKSWESLCEFLDKSNNFGTTLKHDGYIKSAAKEILQKARTDEEKLRMAHDYLKSYKWNKTESLFSSEMYLNTLMKNKSGNSADLNIMLIQLLDKLGFKVTPVLMSTRSHGELDYMYPNLDGLNYVIAQVDLNGKKLLMDATSKNAPYDLLPERCLNRFGMTYDYTKSEIVPLSPERKDKETVMYDLTLEDDLHFTGKMHIQRSDYAALTFRDQYDEFSSQEEFLENMLKDYPGMKILHSEVLHLDSIYLPVREEYEISIKNKVDETNDKIYLYPMMYHQMNENPFNSVQRNYPVDYAWKTEKNITVKVKLPENCEVVTLPEPVKMSLPDDAAWFLYKAAVSGNILIINCKLQINRDVFFENEYGDLREFYSQLIAKHHEPVILRKK